jgi:hypothetical protein
MEIEVRNVSGLGAQQYHHKRLGLLFGRIFGGIVFPTDKPGAAVICGENSEKDMLLKKRHIHALEEVEAESNQALFRKCIELAVKYQVDGFYGCLIEQQRQILSVFNEEARRAGERELHIKDAPLVEDDLLIGHFVQILINRLERSEKSLHLAETPKLQSQLLKIPADISSVKVRDFPLTSAVAIAVGTLDIYKVSDLPAPEQPAYDPLRYGLGGQDDYDPSKF